MRKILQDYVKTQKAQFFIIEYFKDINRFPHLQVNTKVR